MRISVWLATGDDDASGFLVFKYRPILHTLLRGLSCVADVSLNALGPADSMGGGNGLPIRYFRREAIFNGKYNAAVSRLRRGDVLIHIGPLMLHRHPLEYLRARGVRTVFYLTEPEQGCDPVPNVDELWSYTRRVLACIRPPGPSVRSAVRRGRRLTRQVTFRYVPPGYIPPEDFLLDLPSQSAAGPMDMAAVGTSGHLSFMGYPYFKKGRARCWEMLKRSTVGSRLNVTAPVWCPRELWRWWVTSGRREVHLSIHK